MEKSWVEKVDDGLIFHPRRNDENLQRYNPFVTMIWRANTDFSAILSMHAVLAYIAKYVTKEGKTSRDFKEILNVFANNLQESGQFKTAISKFSMSLLCERDYSTQEVTHMLMSYPLLHSSRNIVIVFIPNEETLEIKVFFNKF